MSLAVIDASVLAVFYVADDPRHALVVEHDHVVAWYAGAMAELEAVSVRP